MTATEHADPTHADLLSELDAAIVANEVLVLHGNVDDWFLADDDRPLRVREWLAVRLTSRGFTPVGFSLSGGAEVLVPDDQPAPKLRLPDCAEPLGALHQLTEMLRDSKNRVAVIVDYAEHLAPQLSSGGVLDLEQCRALEVLHRWGTDAEQDSAGNFAILVCREDRLHEQLRRRAAGFRPVAVPLPGLVERQRFVTLLDARSAGQPRRLAPIDPATSAGELAAAATGLRLDDLHRASRTASAHNETLDTLGLVGKRRRAIAELGHGLVELHDTTYGFEAVAGVGHVRDAVRDRQAGTTLSAGLLLAGVPGVGKTFAVKAIAHELHRPLLSLRTIRSQWVGESERNLELTISIVASLAPCVVWFDEVDQLLRRETGPSSDGGTSERLAARLMELMGERAGGSDILWIGTTNRPDLLDPAVVSRFGITVPFLHPAPADLVELIPTLAAQLGRRLADDINLPALVTRPEFARTSGRSLLDVLGIAAAWSTLDRNEPGAPIGSSQLDAALANHRSAADPRREEYLALRAVEACRFSAYLPWRDRNGRREGVNMPDYIVPLVDADGELDVACLAARSNQLAVELGRGW